MPKRQPIGTQNQPAKRITRQNFKVLKENDSNSGNVAANGGILKESDGSTILNGSVLCTGVKYPGAHVSAAGGLKNAVINAHKIGAKSFGLFLRSQRKWDAKPIPDDAANDFIKICKDFKIDTNLILPHGSYLLNLGSPNADVLRKSRELFLLELKTCEKLCLPLYNIHPGSTCGEISREECMENIAININYALSQTKFVKVVLENMSKQGNTIGGDFKELRAIIDKIEDKSRIGVCLDTCHAFAAGYDMKTENGFNGVLEEFNVDIGLKYLVAAHLNDSKGPKGCHLDRHENIGKGMLGKDCFKFLMKSPHFNDIPLILETPFTNDSIYEKEIKLLQKLEQS